LHIKSTEKFNSNQFLGREALSSNCTLSNENKHHERKLKRFYLVYRHSDGNRKNLRFERDVKLLVAKYSFSQFRKKNEVFHSYFINVYATPEHLLE